MRRARGELSGAERAEHADLGRLEPLGDPLGLLDERLGWRAGTAVATRRASTLDGDQDLVLLGDLGGRPISSR